MNWTKVKPETMPQNNLCIYYLCTAEKIDGKRITACLPAFYDSEYGFHYVIGTERVSVARGKIAKVTHWMPWPEPADG